MIRQTSPLEMARYNQPCGCGLSVFEGNLAEFIVCPLHEAAGDLLAVLEAIVNCDEQGNCSLCGDHERQVRTAIAKAKEKPDASS